MAFSARITHLELIEGASEYLNEAQEIVHNE